MNILDENFPEPQRALLRRQRTAVRQIGPDLGRKEMTDEEIIRLLQQLRRPTFFTLDSDYYVRRLCHPRYCLVWLDVRWQEVATYVRRVLRHPTWNTQAKRMGSVIRVSPTGLAAWRLHSEEELHLKWPGQKPT